MLHFPFLRSLKQVAECSQFALTSARMEESQYLSEQTPYLVTYLSRPCIVQDTRVGIPKPFSGFNLSLVPVFTGALTLP